MTAADETIPEPIQKWIDALRSGKFEQTTGALNDDGRFCCLGVACEVAIENGIKVKKETHDDGITAYDGDDGTLPPSVMEWLGLEDRDGSFDAACSSLTYINDTLNKNFLEIADHIEEHWKEMLA